MLNLLDMVFLEKFTFEIFCNLLCHKQSTGLFVRKVCLDLHKGGGGVRLPQNAIAFFTLAPFFYWDVSRSAESNGGVAPQPHRLERRANFYFLTF